jgi:8-oxo-dGTP pyrophosphatase MutT (NUDIX family)
MKQEYSYGAVVYRKTPKGIEYLIEYMNMGHISMPKGHIEKGETPEQCAIREIKEEANIDVILDTSFSKTITYSPEKDVAKDVTYFIATPTSDELIPQLKEVKSLKWVSFEEGVNLLTYQSDKDALIEANTFIKNR